jgi:hypothetical protein
MVAGQKIALGRIHARQVVTVHVAAEVITIDLGGDDIRTVRGGEPRPRARCEKLPAYASPLLLDAQEIEPHTGWHLGNFPRPSRTWRSFNAACT